MWSLVAKSLFLPDKKTIALRFRRVSSLLAGRVAFVTVRSDRTRKALAYTFAFFFLLLVNHSRQSKYSPYTVNLVLLCFSEHVLGWFVVDESKLRRERDDQAISLVRKSTLKACGFCEPLVPVKLEPHERFSIKVRFD